MRPQVYVLEGHGCEVPVEFEERTNLKDGVTLVTFSKCGRSVLIEDSSWIFNPALINNQTVQDYFRYPGGNLDKLEETIGSSVNVYFPGSKIPKLTFFPLSDFSLRHYTTVPETEGQIFSLSGIIPLFEPKNRNEVWKDLHDETAEEANLESGDEGAWCYTNAPETDEDSKEIKDENVLIEFPHSQFQESIDRNRFEYIPYTDIIYEKDEYDDYTDRGILPDRVYNYIYQHSIYKPPNGGDNLREIELSLDEIIKRVTENSRGAPVVIYWNICRSTCPGIPKEYKNRIPYIRTQSGEQQSVIRKILQGPAPVPAPVPAPKGAVDPVEAWLKGGKRRKTRRKNLRNRRKTQKRWTRTRHSRSQRS